MKKVFFTFGSDNNYERPHISYCNFLAQQIKKLDIFDEINVLTGDDLKNDKSFWERHGKFIENNKRGYGYWIWKPYLITQMMNKLNDGDILLYLDAQCIINLNEKNYLINYLEIVKNNKILFTQWKDLPLYEYCFNKMDLIYKLDMQNHELLNTYQNQASIILIYVCKETRELFNTIYYYACENYHNIDDTPSIIPNHINFIDNRHDQSLFSLLTKKNNYSTDITIEKCIYRIL